MRFPLRRGQAAALEFALLAAAETGGDVEAVQGELMPWFIPLLASGALCTGVGAAFFAIAVARSSVLTPPMTRIVVAGFVVYALARIVPLGFAQIVLGLAAIIALWPIAYRMWIAAEALSTTGVVLGVHGGVHDMNIRETPDTPDPLY